MSSRRRRFAVDLAVAALATSLIAACGAEHAAPVATRPPPPSIDDTSVVSHPPGSSPNEAEDDPTADSGPDDTTADSRPVDDSTATSTATTVVVSPISATPEAWAVFDDALSSRLVGRGDYAASVAVAVGGEIVHTAAFGYRVPPPAPPASDETTVPASTLASVPPSSSAASSGSASVPSSTPAAGTTAATAVPDVTEAIEVQDRFRIASISKVITATVVLQLVEAGQIQLDQPVGDVLAQYVGATIEDPAVSAVTVRQLLSHTSGFPDYQGTFFGGSVDSCPEAAQRGLTGGLGVPGTYDYSNLNFCLLGLLIEVVAGRPYEDVVQDRLLQPLGIVGMRMAGTFDPNPTEVLHPSIPSRNYMEVLGAAGAWVATPSDLVTILDSLDPAKPGWHPLSAPMMELMRQPVAGTAYPRPGRWYGLGMMAFGDGLFGHTGTIENTHAMVVDRPDGVTWSVLVSGQVPYETGDLQSIFDQSVADAGITFTS